MKKVKTNIGCPTYGKIASFYMEKTFHDKPRYLIVAKERMIEIFEEILPKIDAVLNPKLPDKVERALEYLKTNKN